MNCYTTKDISELTGLSVQHVKRMANNHVIDFEKTEYRISSGKIALFNDTALEKFKEYVTENHRGKKKNEEPPK